MAKAEKKLRIGSVGIGGMGNGQRPNGDLGGFGGQKPDGDFGGPGMVGEAAEATDYEEMCSLRTRTPKR